MPEIDLLAIGDITTDAFIRLKDAEVNCDIDKENCKICMRFGDKIPYESVTIVPAVGNSPNAAVAAARLGLKSAIVTNIGDDQNGQEAIAQLQINHVATSFVKVNPGKHTNYHYVLWFGDDRTILIKHEIFEYSLPEFSQPASPAGKPKWIYLSSLGENSLAFHEQIANYLKNNPVVKLAFQPGTFQITMGYEKLREIYAHTEFFCANVSEVKKILNTDESDVKKLLLKINELGPKMVMITAGPRGAYAYDGADTWQMPIYPDPKPPLERTGAGDAFTSTVVSALALGKTLPEALTWGPVNSMSVVQEIGAQAGLLKREQLENYLISAPATYAPHLLS